MLIKNGTVYSPGTGLCLEADLRTEGAVVTEFGFLSPRPGEVVLDAQSCVVAPGLVDVHVHFRDPGFTYKEDLHSGACAAAAGGFTTVFCMANTRPVVDNPDTLSDLIRRAREESIRIHFNAAVTKNLNGQELTDFEALAALGACGFTDDGIPLLDEKLVAEAMRRAKALQLPLSFHEEHPAFIEKSGTNRTAPAIAEDLLVARDCMLSHWTNAVIDIQHISSAASVALVRTAKALGAPVFAEATPHHFSLTEDAVARYGTFAKMNPPLRTEADRQAIIEGLKDGTIDIIATDHAPHSTEEKNRADFFAAPSGIIGLETSLGLGITNLVRPGHLTLMQLLEKMTVNPARLYRINSRARACAMPAPETPAAQSSETGSGPIQADALRCENTAAPVSSENTVSRGTNEPGKYRTCGHPADDSLPPADENQTAEALPYGSIFPGCAADLVIFNPEETFTAGNYRSKSANTPFTGMELYGKIHYTICRGEIVWDGKMVP